MRDITLKELFACTEGGEMLVAEKADDGTFVHILDAKPGLSCGCVCPACGRRMVARNRGRKRTEHFAHYGSKFHQNCKSAGETSLHKFAKGLLAGRLEMALPGVTVEDDLGPLRVSEASVRRFDGAVLEKRDGDVVPDVVCTSGEHRLYVEFAVTHPCGEEKVARYRDMGASAIEIDLSACREFPVRELGSYILEHAPRRFLNTRLWAAGEERLQRRREEIEQEAQEKARGVLKALKRLRPCRDTELGEWETRALAAGLGPYLARGKVPASCFSCRPGEWKGFALIRYGYHLRRGFSGSDLLKDLGKRGHLPEPFVDVTPRAAEIIRTSGVLEFVSPREELTAFLDDMVRMGWLGVTEKGKYTGMDTLVLAVESVRADKPLAYPAAH